VKADGCESLPLREIRARRVAGEFEISPKFASHGLRVLGSGLEGLAQFSIECQRAGAGKRRPGTPKSDPEAAKIPISIRLDGSVLATLKTEVERLGIPYQTYIGGGSTGLPKVNDRS